MDRYIYVLSDDSDGFFEDNRTTNFKVQLKYPLYLPGMWKVALVEFNATEKSKSKLKADDGLYIYSDLCKESIVDGEERPLLRRLEKSTKSKWDYILSTPFYVNVAKNQVREFSIYVKGENDLSDIYLQNPVRLTLHLRRYPFL